MLLIIINSTRATKNSYKNLDENHSQYRYFNFKIWRNKEIFLIVATQGFGSGFQISPDSAPGCECKKGVQKGLKDIY